MAGSSVRLDPPCVEFNDVKVGQVYQAAVTVTNTGKALVKITVETPTSKLFSFTMSSSPRMVAPGLSVSGLLEFTPKEEKEVRDHLLIHVDDIKVVEVPLLGFPSACSFLTDSLLDFGCVAANSQVISKLHSITNQGSAPGVFEVQYSGDPSVRMSPCSAVVAAGATQWLKVELCTDGPRHIEEEALLKLQNHSAVVLRIKAEVVDQRLKIFDLQGTPLSCLWFGPVYFGTSQVEKVVLRNDAPQTCDWVCLLQDTTSGTEVGTNLQKSTDVTLLAGMQKCRFSPATQEASQVLVCVPKHGSLGPYEQTTVAVYFSPTCKSASAGAPVHGYRQDYCLYLLFESVGSRYGFTHLKGNSGAELAVTGSGLPVSLVPRPSHKFSFPTCAPGQRADLLCVLQNLCSQLPVSFRFCKSAHFGTEPSAGTIAPGQCQDVVLSFTARQRGRFRVHQRLDILGRLAQRRCAATDRDAVELEHRSFHIITLHLSAICCGEAIHPTPKLNPGLPTAVANQTGLVPCIRSGGLARSAILCADKTRIHRHRQDRKQSAEVEEYLVSPDDRAASLRPASANRQYRTIFTGIQRYRYVDQDYAFTEEQEDERQRHRQFYTDFIQQLRQKRLLRIKERQQDEEEEDINLGMIPCHGLVPPALNISDLEIIPEAKLNLSPAAKDVTAITQHVNCEVMSAVPSSSQEVTDCKQSLTAEELCQVVIGPFLVDFGEVCAQSVCVRNLELTNHLPVFVWVQLEVDCPELQGSSPLSHVLPPHSISTLPLTFQSSKLGHFSRTISYSVNRQHPGQLLVLAQVVSLALELSTSLLVLCPAQAQLAQSGYRGSVTLRNRHNLAADFTWRPVVTERGILFSVRPATGTVEPYRELDCEVVWHPSFSSPPEGDFELCVHEGNTQRLHCTAEVVSTSIHLAEKRVIFDSVPLNMSTIRTAVLLNTGRNHSYYQVLDPCPLLGLQVSPCDGVVPSGGQAELKIHFIPDSVIRFDTIVEIALKNMKSMELRVVGSVEPPNVDISVSHFQFGGVHTGSQRALPFTLTNGSSATARVNFDLAEYPDFSLHLPQCSAKKEPGVNVVELQGNQTVDCSLVFSPTQVASYDFDLPLKVNGVRLPAASPSSSSSSLSAGSRDCIVHSVPPSVTMGIRQSQRVQATVLCAPLEMSPSSVEFHVEPLLPRSDASYAKTVLLNAASEGSAFWLGGIRKHVKWQLGCRTPARLHGSKVELCLVSPSSGSLGPGQSTGLTVSISPEAVTTGSGRVTKLSFPLYLVDEGGGEEESQPYRELSVTITLQLPCISIHPPQILLTPVPLKSNAAATLTLLASGYPRYCQGYCLHGGQLVSIVLPRHVRLCSGTIVSAEVDEVELEDGTKIQPVSIVFPEGNNIPAQNQEQGHPVGIQDQQDDANSLICNVSFSSTVPLSLITTITFTDHLQNKFKAKMCAVTDNCLLTVWPYMTLHRSEQQIVIKTGSGRATAVEAILQRYRTPSPVSHPTSSSSSLFDVNSSTNKSSDSTGFPDSDSLSGQASGTNTDASTNRNTSDNFGVPLFPAADSEEEPFYQNVLLAVERWFSLFGWPSGPHPISVPHTLRRVVSTIQTNQSKGRTYRVTQNQDPRSVMDMLHHLSGKLVPNIPRCQAFSTDVNQRTGQLLQQHEAMLAFLRVQGAHLCHIRPEYLLDVQEFKHWCSLQSDDEENGLDYSSVNYESVSKRSWTDVLLQIYKVLVLCRVSESGLKSETTNSDATDRVLPVCTQPLASNIYSSCELQLLSWLNEHYQSMRETVWGTGGEVPSARWIVNFDLDLTDGLVLAALLAAYCPYLISSHFQRMYTTSSSLEQILHNNIVVVQALNALCLNIDVQATDLSDPNPVQMLILCVHLHERLPQYRPLRTVTLSGALHSTFSEQVHLKNPSSKPIKYMVFLLGEDVQSFSLPDGPAVTVPSKASAELTVHYSCSVMYPAEAVLLLVPRSPFGPCGAALAINLQTRISDITPTSTVKCRSPCYQLKVIQVPITNPFNKEAEFRVVLVESPFNPLQPEKKNDMLVQQANIMASETSCGENTEGKCSDVNGEGGEFLSAGRSVCLKPGQADTLNIHYLPFNPGTKFCSVLLVCPQVGDMVYMVKATAELPLPCPLTARPSANIASITSSPDPDSCVLALSLHCELGQVCEEMVCVPLVNTQWEQALAAWGQLSMSTDEHKRRTLTHSLHSSTVRANTVWHKFKQQARLSDVHHNKGIEYRVEVSLPQYFALPSTVIVPIKEDTNVPWENPADCDCVDIPLRFQADSVGRFVCQVVLSSWCDTRVYVLEALVTSQGKLCLHHDCNSRGAGQHPLLVDHVVLQSPVGQNTQTQLDIPNYTQGKLTLKVVTDLSIVSGAPSLEINPGQSAPYNMSVSPWKRGKQTGYLSFVEIDDVQEVGRCKGCYEVRFSLEIICEPSMPVKSIHVQCNVQSSVAIEIPIKNPKEEMLMLDVHLEGDDLSGANRVSIPPGETLAYQATFSPGRAGKRRGSVVFQSELMGEFWYQLELYTLLPPVSTLPQVCCQLSKQDLSTIHMDPMHGVPTPMPVENAPLSIVLCEVGCRLERKVDVPLTEPVLGNEDRKGQEVFQAMTDDFLCEIRAGGEVEDCLFASVETAMRDPDTGILTLSLHLVFTPLRPCRCTAVIAVRRVSGGIWEFPVPVVSTGPEVDDVIITESTEVGRTSSVGFRLTSTTGRPEPFTAAFLPGAGDEFTVTPAAGVLPPAGSTGALIIVAFTPSTHSHHRAILTIQATDKQWTYEVRGKTCLDAPPTSTMSTNGSSSLQRPAAEQL